MQNFLVSSPAVVAATCFVSNKRDKIKSKSKKVLVEFEGIHVAIQVF